MTSHSVLPASHAVFGACQSPRLSIATSPVQDHLGFPSCSTLRSSHSEILSTELLLQDLVSEPCHGVQKKYLKGDKHEVSDHTVNGRRQAMDLNSVNRRHQVMDCEECNDSNESVSLCDHLPSRVLKVSNTQDKQDVDMEAHCRPSENRSKTGHYSPLRLSIEAQTVEEALAFIEGIVDEPLPTDIFIPILKKCRKHRALAPAKRLHLHMCKHGFESHGVLNNFLISIYVDSGCVEDAQQLVNRLETIDQHSWNTLIQGYLESGESKKAFRLYKEMDGNFVHCRRYILMALLLCFSSQKSIEECQELHAKIVERELESDLYFCNTLIDMYIKCESPISAQEVLNEHPCKDIVLFSTLIVRYTDRGHFEDVLRCLDQAVLEGLDPDVATLACSLKACASVQNLDKGREIHTLAVKHMLERDTVVGNSLVDMYAKCGALSDSQEVFDKLPVRNVVAWSALIAGYADHDFGEEALKRFDQMQLSGIIPNNVTFLCVLKACISTGAIDKGQAIHAEIAAEEYDSDFLVSSALMDMYSKFGLLSEARFLFARLPVQNVITWTALIEAYAEHGLHGRAFKCFQLMQSSGIPPNSVTFLCILKACCSGKSIDKGRDLHSEITMRAIEGDPMVGMALVGMYAKCGSPEEARFTLDRLSNQCVVSWTAFIAGYVKHGQGEEAFHHFEQMKEKGVLPEVATYLYILKSCGDTEDLELGQIIHMEVLYRGFDKDDRVSPVLVYMYAKNASLAEAQSMFDNLQNRDLASWHILMGSFVEQGLHEVALTFLRRMEREGVLPEATTWILCLKACQANGLINKVYDLHLQIVKQGFETDSSIGHLILETYAFHGSFEDSKAVFDRLPDCDPANWRTMISRLC